MQKKALLFALIILFTFQISWSQTPYKVKTLLNGVEVQDTWPPQTNKIDERKEMPVPYLQRNQKVIPVNMGRQLFVDDFLIKSTNLAAVSHTPVYSKSNPVLEPDKEWESNESGPYAAPFSDGIWFDEKDQKFKMWYLAGSPNKSKQAFQTCYAESKDGVNWLKPNLGIYGNTNIVDTFDRDASVIWLDKQQSDPLKRYLMFSVQKPLTYDDGRFQEIWKLVLKYSPDGINWSNRVAQSGGDLSDRNTAFYNPFSNKWVISIRYESPVGRARNYLENKSPEKAVNLTRSVKNNAKDTNIVYWFGADNKDPRHPNFKNIDPQIYNFDAIAYESLMLGYFTVWQGPENNVCDSLGIQKRNEVLIGYSRNGFHYSRPSHKPFMGVNEVDGAWNWGNVQSIAGVPIIKGDSLYFYVSGRRLNKEMWDAYTTTGLATLRRDGFVSMNTDRTGYLLTRDLSFDGDYFFINADVKGELRVEIQDSNGNIIPGFSAKDCIPMKGNSTKFLVTWKGKKDLSKIKNKIIKVKFYLTKGDLYSFWISPWSTGESRGYTAGGGPGLSSTGSDIK